MVGLNFLPAWNKIEKKDAFLVRRRLPAHALSTQLAEQLECRLVLNWAVHGFAF
jgi:hypothetical protein